MLDQRSGWVTVLLATVVLVLAMRDHPYRELVESPGDGVVDRLKGAPEACRDTGIQGLRRRETEISGIHEVLRVIGE